MLGKVARIVPEDRASTVGDTVVFCWVLVSEVHWMTAEFEYLGIRADDYLLSSIDGLGPLTIYYSDYRARCRRGGTISVAVAINVLIRCTEMMARWI